MPLRIACDLDGTLADMGAALQREAGNLFGPDAGDFQRLTGGQQRRLWEHVGDVENFWLSLPEIEPGGVARLAVLAALHRWEVLFLTQRPATAGETAQIQTQRWLEAHGFELPSVYVMEGSRGKLAAALGIDAVIDDRAENCVDVATESKARAFLVWREDPASVPSGAAHLGIETVFSTADALDRLEQMTLSRQKPDGVVGRVRAAIGL
jgi:hypothetical protein